MKYPIGAERVRDKKKNLILVKTAPDTWIEKSVCVWEQANGKLPEGYRILFADQNKYNFELDNLIPVTMREIFYMNRHGLISTDRELTKTGLALARHSLAIVDRVHSMSKTKSRSQYIKTNSENTGHYTVKRLAKKLGFN